VSRVWRCSRPEAIRRAGRCVRAEQVTLRPATAQFNEQAHLFGSFDAFHHQFSLELRGQCGHGAHDGLHHRVVQFMGEGLVQLDLVKRQGVQSGQARLASAKVVDGNADAVIAQGLQLLAHDVHIVVKQRFGDFEFQMSRQCRVGRIDGGEHARGEIGQVQLQP
jgi:hypothetical protein